MSERRITSFTALLMVASLLAGAIVTYYSTSAPLKKQIEEHHANINILVSEKQNLESQISSMEETISEMEDQISTFETEMDSMTEEITLLETEIAKVEEEIFKYKVKVSELDAEITLLNTQYDIESNQINLAKMSHSASFSGVIAELPFFTDGTRVASNTLMVKVIDYRKLYMEANLPEKYFKNIERGYKVYVTSYTSTADTLTGFITQISPSIDPDARTFKCFVEVDNIDGILLPGMFVKADLVVNSAENTLVIPRDIIVSRNRNQIVYVVDKGVASERVITTGLENENSIEVKMGLLEGESVVNTGFETLRNQSRVRILR